MNFIQLFNDIQKKTNKTIQFNYNYNLLPDWHSFTTSHHIPYHTSKNILEISNTIIIITNTNTTNTITITTQTLQTNTFTT